MPRRCVGMRRSLRGGGHPLSEVSHYEREEGELPQDERCNSKLIFFISPFLPFLAVRSGLFFTTWQFVERATHTYPHNM